MKVAKHVTAALLAALAVACTVMALRWPLEAGSILFTPMLLGVAGLAFLGAVALVVPPRPKRPPAPPNPWVQALCGVFALIVCAMQLVRWVT